MFTFLLIRHTQAALITSLLCTAVFAQEVGTLNTFENGKRANADEVNSNFTTLKSAVNDNNGRIGTLESTATTLGSTTADHETRVRAVENLNSSPIMPDKLYRAGNIADIARGRPVAVTAGTITDFGPTSEYSTRGGWQTTTFSSNMTLDFGESMGRIFEITFQSFFPTDVRYIPAYSGTGSYKLEYSDDNSNWTSVPAVAPVQNDIFVHRLATTGISARYIRLVVNAPNVPGNQVKIGTFQVLSYAYGDSTAIDARRVYGNGPMVLADPDPTKPHRLELASGGGSHIFGTNNSGNLHIDSDKTKVDGRIYLNYNNGKGVNFGDGAGRVVGSVDPLGNVNFAGAYAQNGVPIHGVVAGGTCLGGVSTLWDPMTINYGGATCTGAAGYDIGIRTLNCPAGTTKWILIAMTNSGSGGEGGICIL